MGGECRRFQRDPPKSENACKTNLPESDDCGDTEDDPLISCNPPASQGDRRRPVKSLVWTERVWTRCSGRGAVRTRPQADRSSLVQGGAGWSRTD